MDKDNIEQENSTERLLELKKAIVEVGISQNRLLLRYAEDTCFNDVDVDAEVARLKRSMQPSRQNISNADIERLFNCLTLMNKELKNDLVVSGSIKGGIKNNKLSNVFSSLSKDLDKKLAATEEL